MLYRGMKIVVKTLATLYSITGSIKHELEVPNDSTIYDVIKIISKMYPRLEKELFRDDGGIRENYRIFLNGREVIHIGGLDTKVGDGDIVTIIPPVGGG